MKNYYSLVVVSVLCICCGGVDKRNDNKVVDQEYKSKEDSLSTLFNRASKQADQGISEGFLKLYKIATDDVTYSVERSEVATTELHELFITKTDAWVRVFASLDSQEIPKFKEYLDYSGVVDGVFADDSISDRKQYQKLVISKLEKIKGNLPEKELIRYLKVLVVREKLP